MFTNESVQIISWSDMLTRHEPAWRRLWVEAGAVPDLGPAWARALAIGHRIDPTELWCVISLGADGELDFVWPLRRQRARRAGLWWWSVGPLLNVYCMHSGLLCRGPQDRARSRAWQALVEGPLRWDWFYIEAVVDGSAEHHEWLAHAQNVGVGLHCIAEHRSPYLAHNGTLDDLITQRSRNFREKIRARRRELQRGLADGGTLAWQQFTRPEEMSAYLDLARQVELKSWKHAEGTAITSRDWETGFYESLLTSLAAEGQVCCTVLFSQGQPVGHSIDLRGGQRVYGVKWSYDLDHAKLRPGVLLMVGRLERYFADGVVEFDFLGADEAYKLQWTPATRDHLTLRIHARSLGGRLTWAGDRAVRAIKRMRRGGEPPNEAVKPAAEAGTVDA